MVFGQETWANPFSSVGLSLPGWKWGPCSPHPANVPRFGEDPKPPTVRELRYPDSLLLCARTGLGAGDGRAWQPWGQPVP